MQGFDAALFAPLYSVFGTSATLTPSGGSAVVLTVVDQSAGRELVDLNTDAPVVYPVAAVRASVLDAAGVELSDLRGAALTMNGRTWSVDTFREMPSPFGQTDGEVLMILIEVS